MSPTKIHFEHQLAVLLNRARTVSRTSFGKRQLTAGSCLTVSGVANKWTARCIRLHYPVFIAKGNYCIELPKVCVARNYMKVMWKISDGSLWYFIPLAFINCANSDSYHSWTDVCRLSCGERSEGADVPVSGRSLSNKLNQHPHP